jgi:4a-hydroxytetrahydrobiopterin dehydratase
MTRLAKLDENDIQRRLSEIDGWSVKKGKLHKDFRFASFAEAFAFMTRVAHHAGQMDHHPEWFNVYNRVTVDLMTHDVGGISDADFELALHMDQSVAGQ